MSIVATITKHFHRNTNGVMLAGDVVKETMPFVDYDAMDRFGEQINANHKSVPYHITNAFIDSKNFVCFDLSEISETYPDLEWRELR